jgi:2-keto-4-pentenoate hydratase/2-oxohepta-3-ene-1,7-dioic acid hydratase in catechol pathway
MRLATLAANGIKVVAAGTEDGWRRIEADGLLELLQDGDIDRIELGEQLPASARLLAPIRPPKIMAIGLNYADHIRESGAEQPERPLVFAKLPTSVIGTEEPIPVDARLTERPDWEVELAVIIGRTVRNVSVDRALECVAGYTIANDVSARDVQFSDGQWVRGKSFDGFCPLGPWMVTSDEIADPQRLALQTRVNGETLQDSNTSEMIFGVRELVAYCSRGITLEAGDVLLTGTPWGVGEFMNPRRSLRGGDIVECEIERIGTLRNAVVAVAAASAQAGRQVDGS